MIKKLARVSKAGFEIQERGILNFWVFVDYEEGCSQGVGGIALDQWNEEKREREGTAYGCEMIRQLLLFFGVNNLTDIKKDTMVYVLGEGDGFGFQPKGFEHLNVLRGNLPERIVFEDIAKEFIK